MKIEQRIKALEAKIRPHAPDDWQERLAKYKRWFAGEEWEGPETDEEKADFARYKKYFDDLEKKYGSF
jgi:hypothetical protein